MMNVVLNSVGLLRSLKEVVHIKGTVPGTEQTLNKVELLFCFKN